MQNIKWQVADTIEYELLKENAKMNRVHMTDAESAFWSVAKGCGLGSKCRRQYIIGNYIVDFFFREKMLVVEIDGEYHFTDEQKQEDFVRQQWLEQHGYHVLRFTNEEVLFNLEETIIKIKEYLSL